MLQVANRLVESLAGVRVHLDKREGLTPGFMFNDWEMRGVPLRLEIGPRDVAEGTVTLARRDFPGKAGKQAVGIAEISNAVERMLSEIQGNLYARALEFREANTHDPEDYAQFKEVVKSGWADSWWCGAVECETEIKESTKATVRCIPLDQPGGEGICIHCGERATQRAIFARAY